MATIQVPTEVVIETQENLPNGSYCNGGPSGPSINKMSVYVGENTSSKEFYDVVLEYFMEKAKESFYTKTSVAGTASTKKQTAERTGPNTVECDVPAGPITVKISLSVFISGIRFRGGEIQVNESHMMEAADGYEISVNQKMSQKAQGLPGCCSIM